MQTDQQAPFSRRLCAWPPVTLVVALGVLAGANLGAQSLPGSQAAQGESMPLSGELRRFRVYPHLDRAYRLIKNHKLADAKRELETCVAIDDQDVTVWSTYFDVLYQLKDYDGLIARYERLGDLREQPRLRKYHLLAQLERENTDAVLKDLQAVTHGGALVTNTEMQSIAPRLTSLARKQQRPDLLLAFVAAIPDSAPSAPGKVRLDAYKAIGDMAVARNDWTESIRWYRQWLSKSDPSAIDERSEVYNALGHAYSELGQHGPAAEAFEMAAETAAMALKARPDDVQILVAAVQALQKAGRTTDALHRLQTVPTVLPTGDLNAQVGLLYAQLGRHRDALPYLERARDLGVSQALAPVLLGQLGYAYAALNQPQAARKAFAEALPNASNPAAIQAALGRTSLVLKDYRSAIDHFQRSLSLHDDPQLWRVLALTHAQAGDVAAADRIIDRLRRLTNRDSVLDADFWNQMAETALHEGRFRDAATLFRRASTGANLRGWPALARAAESLERAEAPSEAAGIWEEVANAGRAPNSSRGDAAERAGYLHLRLGDTDQAAADFLLAIRLGRDGWRLRLDHALALTKLERWREALDESMASLERQETARGQMTAALSFKALDKPGMAVHHFIRSLEHAGELDGADQKYVLDELAYLYAGEANYDEARMAATRSLTIANDPAMALLLARMQRRLGRKQDARVTLSSLDSPSLSRPLRAAVLDEEAHLRADLGDKRRAAEALQKAVELEPSGERLYQLGIYYRDVGDLQRAMSYLHRSLVMAPNDLDFRAALGYTYLQARRFSEAADSLSTVARAEPDNVQVRQDLASALARLGNTPGAVRWLHQAIDQVRSQEDLAGSNLERQQALLRMRTTVTQLEKQYEGSAYVGYQTLAAPYSLIDGTQRPLLVSQSGVELSRSLSDGQRGWSAFGRFMTFSDGQANALPTRGTFNQVGIGIRYKPFLTQNFSVSAERLFQLPSGPPGSWLVRGLFSKEQGAEVQSDQQWHPYSLVYGDLAGFIGPSSSLLAYGEARGGVSRSLTSSVLVRPHVVAVARNRLAGPGSNALQIGAGIGILYYFGESTYRARGRSLEVRLYRTGALVGGSNTNGYDGVKGLTLVTSVRF